MRILVVWWCGIRCLPQQWVITIFARLQTSV